MVKNILITGGAGFIGCNFVRYMLAKYPNWNFSVLDDFSFSRMENLEDVKDQISFVRGDICEYNDVIGAAKDTDVIVNFAAQTHVDRSITNSKPFVVTEVLGTDNLLKVAREIGVDKYLQVSTDEVYGEIFEQSFRETDPLNPRNPYSAAKAGADLLVKASWITFGTPILITRCSNNFGQYQHIEKFIPKIITRAIDGKRIPVYGDGSQIRDWIHVLDHCSAIDTVLEKGELGNVYNIATGKEVRNVDLALMILEFLGRRKELIEFVTDRPGHDKRYSIDSSRIRSLGWTPHVDFETGIRSVIDWYSKNENWWRTLAAD